MFLGAVLQERGSSFYRESKGAVLQVQGRAV